MNWQVFPTETRRFSHTLGFMLIYDTKRNTWDVSFRIQHSEVCPHGSYKTKCNISVDQKDRLVRVGNKMTHSVRAFGNEVVIFYDKPIPACEFPSCKRQASVPDYTYNQGKPYYCVNHRGY